MPARYTAVPALPQTGVDEWQSRFLSAVKENVELLTGTRGEFDLASAAINRSTLTVSQPPEQQMTRVSAVGNGTSLPSGFQINPDGSGGYVVDVTGNVSVPLLDDYNRLVLDVQRLSNDVANLRGTVAVLIAQLRG